MIIDMIKNTVARFRKDEDGIALTEYLVLLGLLVAGVITAVLLFGTQLSGAWNSWAGWVSTAVDAP
jgi:pilus assembly protein Flp/PilA